MNKANLEQIHIVFESVVVVFTLYFTFHLGVVVIPGIRYCTVLYTCGMVLVYYPYMRSYWFVLLMLFITRPTVLSTSFILFEQLK